MTKFYEISLTNGKAHIINLAMIVDMHDLEGVCEGGPCTRLVMANNAVHDVVKHSLMMALHHSETPYMLMGPPESEVAGDLGAVSTDDITEVTEGDGAHTHSIV